jgi:predicted transcriptional regulator
VSQNLNGGKKRMEPSRPVRISEEPYHRCLMLAAARKVRLRVVIDEAVEEYLARREKTPPAVSR